MIQGQYIKIRKPIKHTRNYSIKTHGLGYMSRGIFYNVHYFFNKGYLNMETDSITSIDLDYDSRLHLLNSGLK